jgi:hypothetical protein
VQAEFSCFGEFACETVRRFINVGTVELMYLDMSLMTAAYLSRSKSPGSQGRGVRSNSESDLDGRRTGLHLDHCREVQ